MGEGLEDARKQKMEKHQQEIEATQREEQLKGVLRMALTEDAYGRLMNVRLASPQLYSAAARQALGLHSKVGRKLTERELIALLKAIKGKQRETKITFR